ELHRPPGGRVAAAARARIAGARRAAPHHPARLRVPRAQCLLLQLRVEDSARHAEFLHVHFLHHRGGSCGTRDPPASLPPLRGDAAAPRTDGQASSRLLSQRGDVLVLRHRGMVPDVRHHVHRSAPYGRSQSGASLNGSSRPMAATPLPPTRRGIWYGIFAAPVAFGFQEMLNWLISSGACPSGNPADIGGIPLFPHTRPILWGIGAAALVAAAVALWIGIAAW